MIWQQTITLFPKSFIKTLGAIRVNNPPPTANIQRDIPNSSGGYPVNDFEFHLPLPFQNTIDQKLIGGFLPAFPFAESLRKKILTINLFFQEASGIMAMPHEDQINHIITACALAFPLNDTPKNIWAYYAKTIAAF